MDTTGAFTFNHLPPTEGELFSIPDLTSFGYDMLRDSIKRALDQQKVVEKDDYDLLTITAFAPKPVPIPPHTTA